MKQKYVIAGFSLLFSIAGHLTACRAGENTGSPVPGPGDGKIYVGSAAELNALSGLKAGDTVVLRNGTYADAKIRVKAEGTAASPVVVMGETPGLTVLTGDSKIGFSGRHVVVRDLWFRDVSVTSGAVIEFRSSSGVFAYQSRVTNCAITARNVAASEVDAKWVSLYGTENQVDGCSFVDKKNMGALLVVWLETDVVPKHKILNNYFSRPDGTYMGKNGQETIRIGTSGFAHQNADCLVEGNHFYRCVPEIEVISGKSCGNVYRNNLFTESRALTLRHGHRAVVESNYFIGNGASSTCGIRVIGEDHLVKDNYMENLTNTGSGSAVCLEVGTDKAIDPSPAGYEQVKRARIENNVVVDCKSGFVVNAGGGGIRTKQVVESTMVGNTLVSSSGSNSAIYFYPMEGTDLTWTNNTIYGGTYTGITEQEVPRAAVKPTVARPTAKIDAVAAGCGVGFPLVP